MKYLNVLIRNTQWSVQTNKDTHIHMCASVVLAQACPNNLFLALLRMIIKLQQEEKILECITNHISKFIMIFYTTK